MWVEFKRVKGLMAAPPPVIPAPPPVIPAKAGIHRVNWKPNIGLSDR